MALLLEAAAAWAKLLDTSYQFTYGKKRTLFEIALSFSADQFYHLSGFQYINDIDFQIPIRKETFFCKLLSSEIDVTSVEASAVWPDIEGRMKALVRLEDILDSDFSLFRFNPKVLRFHSDIPANFLIKNDATGDVVFLFVDGPLHESFCRSIFTQSNCNYAENQSRLSLLKKVKVNSAEMTVFFDKLKAAPAKI